MLNLDNSIIYDIEVFPNCFLFCMEMLNSDTKAVWEISYYRDDRQQLIEFLRWLSQTQTPMIGFNNLSYDYPMMHYFWFNSNATAREMRIKNDAIFSSQDRFGHMIWASDRFAPQIDVFKMNHFDNKAKSTSLKTLQINMRSSNVVECELGFERDLTQQEINSIAIPYNFHDVSETKKFVLSNMSALEFRLGLINQFGVEVLNWNDTKIGEQMVIQKLGNELCYDYSSGRRKIRQTPRSAIGLNDIIFPYIKFENLEFNRVLTYLKQQVLKSDEINAFGEDAPLIQTKGVFTDLKATVGGVDFHYGVGGIHGSVERKRVESGNGFVIRDIDVASLYPSIAIANNLAPEHLGSDFVRVYSELPKERKRWQEEKGKKCTEANALKLASNGVYGKSNSVWSPFYDPKFTMTITVNGQLLLSMLIERLVNVPTLQLIQGNTDGLTYYVNEKYVSECQRLEREWQNITGLVLEDVLYDRMFIRDVNNYIGVGVDGSIKLKGAYWTPDPLDYHGSVASSQPPAWHKSFNAIVSTRAAVAHMVHGVDIEQFIRMTDNPYDFCSAVKINRSDKLMWGDVGQQRNTRFYVSTQGHVLNKIMPPTGKLGAYKKANGVTDAEYESIMNEVDWEWDERVCTKNKSKYETRETQVIAGQLVKIVNDINKFDFNDVNYQWYIDEAKKLLI